MKTFARVLSILSFCVSGAVFAAPAGYFHEVTGDVALTPSGGSAMKVAIGDLFESGARVVTGAGGRAVLKFADGEVVALAPNSDFTVSSYIFDRAKPAEGNVTFNLVRGGMRFVTGLIGKANPSRFAVRTPTITAGVRGSAGEVIVSGDGPGGQIQVLVGSSEDQVVVTGPNGQQVVLSPGNFSFTAGNGQPSQPFTAGNAPPAAQALLNAAAALLQMALPPNTAGDPAQDSQARKSEANQSAAAPPASQAQSLVTGAGAGGGGGGGTTSPNR